MRTKNHIHINGFALSLVLKQKLGQLDEDRLRHIRSLRSNRFRVKCLLRKLSPPRMPVNEDENCKFIVLVFCLVLVVNIQLQLKIFTDESLLWRVLFHNIPLLAFAGILRHLYYEVHRKVWKEASFNWYVNIEICLAICVPVSALTTAMASVMKKFQNYL